MRVKRDADNQPVIGDDGKPVKVKTEMTIEVIPNSSEKYLSFRICDMQFKDSYGFMASSLDTLVNILVNSKGESAFRHTHQLFNEDGENWKLMLKKGVYPYEFMDSFAKFNSLIPSIEHFLSKVQ